MLWLLRLVVVSWRRYATEQPEEASLAADSLEEKLASMRSKTAERQQATQPPLQ